VDVAGGHLPRDGCCEGLGVRRSSSLESFAGESGGDQPQPWRSSVMAMENGGMRRT